MLALCEPWRGAWQPADARPIEEWAADNVRVLSGTMKGPFSVRQSRWMIEVFAALKDLSVRQVCLRKAVKIGGTLTAEIFYLWAMVNDPDHLSWTMQNEQEMEDHLKSRLWPLMEDGCNEVRKRLPPVGDMRTINRIHFGAFSVYFNSATRGQQQAKDIRWKINDEIWMWKDGILGEANARTAAFARIGLSKIFNISQAGVKGDAEDMAFIEGHQADLFILCPLCKKSTPLSFEVLREDKTRAGVIFPDCKTDGYFNAAKAAACCRYACRECGHEMAEGEQTRRQWFTTQHWIAQNSNAPPHLKSFHVESLAATKMPDLVAMFCHAYNSARRGFPALMTTFRQQQQALPWVEKGEAIDLRGGTKIDAYKSGDYANGELWWGEEARAMTIDRQKDHFWVEVRAWKSNGDSRQIFFGRVQQIEEARLLQVKLKVPDYHVMEDCGYDEPSVLKDCVRFRERVPGGQAKNGWVALRGEKQKRFLHEGADGKKEEKFFSTPQRVLHGTEYVWKIYFSADNCKDILAPRMRGTAGARWDLPADVSVAYVEHCNAEQKLELQPGYWTWQPVPKGKPNHGFDCANMQIVFALIKKFISGEK